MRVVLGTQRGERQSLNRYGRKGVYSTDVSPVDNFTLPVHTSTVVHSQHINRCLSVPMVHPPATRDYRTQKYHQTRTEEPCKASRNVLCWGVSFHTDVHGHVQPQAASAFELRHRYREYDQFTKEIAAYDAQTLVEERELAEWTDGCTVTLLRRQRHLDEAEETIKEQRREIDQLVEEDGTARDEYRHLKWHACGPLKRTK
jgi:hypothetical protein